MSSTTQNERNAENFFNVNLNLDQNKIIKFERDKVDLSLLDQNETQKSEETYELILKKYSTILAFDNRLSFIECTGLYSRYHISLLTMYLIKPTSLGLQLPQGIKDSDVPNILGYFCAFRNGNIELFSTFNEYSQLRYNEYMLFNDIYLGFTYKFFFVLLGTSRFGHFIFEAIRNNKKINSNILNIKDYFAPLIIISILLILFFVLITILVSFFSRLLFLSLIIIGLIAQIWNTITWPSLYFLSLQFKKYFFSNANVNVSLARYESNGAPQFKSFYLQIKSLIYDNYNKNDLVEERNKQVKCTQIL